MEGGASTAAELPESFSEFRKSDSIQMKKIVSCSGMKFGLSPQIWILAYVLGRPRRPRSSAVFKTGSGGGGGGGDGLAVHVVAHKVPLAALAVARRVRIALRTTAAESCRAQRSASASLSSQRDLGCSIYANIWFREIRFRDQNKICISYQNIRDAHALRLPESSIHTKAGQISQN